MGLKPKPEPVPPSEPIVELDFSEEDAECGMLDVEFDEGEA